MIAESIMSLEDCGISNAIMRLKWCVFSWRGIRAFARKDAAYWDRGGGSERLRLVGIT